GVARRVRRDGQLPAQPAGPEQLDRQVRAGQARLVDLGRLHGGAVLEAVQLGQVDDGVDLLEPVLEAAQLGQPLRQRHLTALEAEPEGLAASVLALLAAARRLASAGTGSAPDPSRLLPRPFGCTKLVQVHSDYLPLECFLADRVRGIL